MRKITLLMTAVLVFVVGCASSDQPVIPVTAASAMACQMGDVQPDSGSMTLRFIKDSTRNSDRNDYRLEGSIRWEDAAGLLCAAEGIKDWGIRTRDRLPKAI